MGLSNCELTNNSSTQCCQACFHVYRYEGHWTINGFKSREKVISMGWWMGEDYEEQETFKKSDYPINYFDHLNIRDLWIYVVQSVHVETIIRLNSSESHDLNLIRSNRLLQKLFKDAKIWNDPESTEAEHKCIESLLGVTIVTVQKPGWLGTHKEIRDKDANKHILGDYGSSYYLTADDYKGGQCTLYLLHEEAPGGRDEDSYVYGYEIKNFTLPSHTIEILCDCGITTEIAYVIQFMALS